MQNFNITVHGESKVLGVSYTPCEIQKDKNLWQLEVENGSNNAFINFLADNSPQKTDRLRSMLYHGCLLKFKGTVEKEKVVATELYLNAESMIEVVL